MDFIWELICILSYLFMVQGDRIVPLKQDLCRRMPNILICKQGLLESSVATPLPPTPPPVFNGKTMTSGQCSQYQSYFDFYCQSNHGSTSEHPNTMSFCLNFALACKNSAPRSGSMSQKTSSNYYKWSNLKNNVNSVTKTSEKSLLEQCQQFAPDAQKYCNQYGNERDTNHRTQCNTFRQLCRNFSTNFHEISPETKQKVETMCQMYRPNAEKYCIGYEVVELRQYCNIYRVYCKKKRPFPNIEGNIGITSNNWGVFGIPFYPFNPQGAIAGGKRTDITFGDWGAQVGTKTGITDFFEGSRGFTANWQKGQFGGGTGFKIPFLGLGAYNTRGVSLGGILNPSDIPTMLAGGVPEGRPLSGLGNIPLLLGQPFQPPYTNNEVANSGTQNSIFSMLPSRFRRKDEPGNVPKLNLNFRKRRL